LIFGKRQRQIFASQTKLILNPLKLDGFSFFPNKTANITAGHGQSNMNKELKICYWNCRGLSKGKLDMTHSLLGSTFDIIILAEHWFSHQDQMEASPLFVFSSPRPLIEKQVGHENGGLALFARPDIQDSMTNLSSTEFTLSFSFHNQTILSTY
jgi:hypothetical protein